MRDLPNIEILDLNFLGQSDAIASFLIESDDGLILIETGPESTFKTLKRAIEDAEYDWKDVKHVLLTHIHFDHAGAAWKFAENGAKIYVHPIGLPHLQNPERLWNSAKMIYKEEMETLWGRMEPIDESLLVPAKDGDTIAIGKLEFKVHYTPGHAVHHNAYQIGTTIFTGDVAGVHINHGPVQPPCPPPDINIGLWKLSIRKLKNLHPEVLYLTHYGIVANPQEHLDKLEKELNDWANWMKPHYDNGEKAEIIIPDFMAYTKQKLVNAGVAKSDIARYEKANPSWMSVSGLLRYWKLKEQGRI